MTAERKAKPTVLVVDDEKNIRDGLLQALEDDYYVGLAENGQRALLWLDSHHADAVLTDLRMPGMDGMELLPRLLALDPPPVVVMLMAGSIISFVAHVQGVHNSKRSMVYVFCSFLSFFLLN